jgi:hypothetical protein
MSLDRLHIDVVEGETYRPTRRRPYRVALGERLAAVDALGGSTDLQTPA